MIEFNPTERFVLLNHGGYSRQLVAYWEKTGCVPSKHLIRVSKLIGRKVEELLKEEDKWVTKQR